MSVNEIQALAEKFADPSTGGISKTVLDMLSLIYSSHGGRQDRHHRDSKLSPEGTI